jgi:hypothetical protein
VIFPYIYMYYNPNCFISSLFLLFTLVPLLWMVSTGLKILYSFWYRQYINHIHLLSFLLLPSLSRLWPLLMICFS